MERVEYILSLIGTILSFLVALLTLVVKLMKVLKDKSITEDREKLVEKLLELVVEAEGMLDYSGKEKKAYVMEKISEFASETDIEADLEFISEENGAEKVWYIKELNLDTKTNCFYNQFDLENGIETLEAVTYGGGVWAEFKEINIKKIRFTVEVPEGQESVGLSEIAVMGRKR